jgi:hypothetical protein
MSEFTKSVEKSLLLLTCSSHNKQPEVIVDGDEIKYNVCCEEFGAICKAEVEKALHASAINQMKNIFK